MDWQRRLQERLGETEDVVTRWLPEETGHQKLIFQAMNYSVLAGGKRLRPMLMKEVYRLFGGQGREIEPFMAAIEMIHTSSLVHDDLPAMDADEYRRGKKTTWVVYGEDMAILAGDALMIYAFEVAAKAFGLTEHPMRVGKAVGLLAEKTGIYGMIGGQTVDVDYDTSTVYVDGQPLDEPYIKEPTYTPEGVAFPLTLAEDEVFVMGDNRNHSTDSRDTRLGPVKEGYLQGKALLLLTPGVTPDTGRTEWGRVGLVR